MIRQADDSSARIRARSLSPKYNSRTNSFRFVKEATISFAFSICREWIAVLWCGYGIFSVQAAWDRCFESGHPEYLQMEAFPVMFVHSEII